MKSKLFTYALIWHPTDEEAKNGKKSVIIKDPTHFLAKDEKTASLQVAMEIPAEYKDKLDQVEIVLSSF